MLKLFDAQVTTLMLINFRLPAKPADMSRYPNIQMFLDKEIVREVDGRLAANHDSEEVQQYEYVFPLTPHQRSLSAFSSFEELEAKNLMIRGEQIVKRWFFWDAIQLRNQIKKLGGDLPYRFVGNITCWNLYKQETKALVSAFKTKHSYPEGPILENEDNYRKRLRRTFPEIDSVIAEASGEEVKQIGINNNCHRLGWLKLSNI